MPSVALCVPAVRIMVLVAWDTHEDGEIEQAAFSVLAIRSEFGSDGEWEERLLILHDRIVIPADECFEGDSYEWTALCCHWPMAEDPQHFDSIFDGLERILRSRVSRT